MISFKNHKRTTIRRFWLYVIALEQGKYYVGITARKDPYIRLRQHGGPHGARWTHKYKPLKPLQILRLEKLGALSLQRAEQCEQAVFEEYRKQFGLRNVRGGRIVSSGPVFRLGQIYVNHQMLEALAVVVIVLLYGIYTAITQ
jgi:predicted GIY-YIG superfamily endonuclease